MRSDPRGSVWRQWDFHFHTPASYDYKDMSVTDEQIVDGLIGAKDFRSAAASIKANQPRTPSPTADAADTRRTTSQSGPADTGRYAVTIKTAETSDEAVVAQILKDLNIQFVTRKGGPVTRLVCKPSKAQMTGLLTNLGTWLDTNTPSDFEVRVGR